MNLLIALIAMAGAFQQTAPADTLSLQECYRQVMDTYPVAAEMELQQQITDLNTAIAHTGYYPRVGLSGKATYQSEVPEISIPGAASSGVSKDQYEAAVNITQNIYNGGVVSVRKELEKARGAQALESARTELHKIRGQVDQVYFGILLSQSQQEQNQLLIENLTERLSDVRSAVENGVLLSGQQYILEAELIKARQDSAGIRSNTRAGYQVLGELMGTSIPENTKLEIPDLGSDLYSLSVSRPELSLFESNFRALEVQKELAGTRKAPQISAFANAAYGRPGFNFLNDDFHDYYMVGINLKWNLLDFLNSDEEQQVIDIQQRQIREKENAFSIQLEAQLKRIRERIATLEENLQRDLDIISLREQIVAQGESQLNNGAITATEYITELNQLNRAQLSLQLNRVQLAQAEIDYLTALGADLFSLTSTD